jgi:hypothetical protein
MVLPSGKIRIQVVLSNGSSSSGLFGAAHSGGYSDVSSAIGRAAASPYRYLLLTLQVNYLSVPIIAHSFA